QSKIERQTGQERGEQTSPTNSPPPILPGCLTTATATRSLRVNFTFRRHRLRVGEIVEKLTAQKGGSKQDWALTQGAFERLLDWLGQDSELSGERYLEMRKRLVLYFDRKGCLSPDDLADETLNRVARRLEEEGTIISDAPAHYCY